MQRRRSKKPPTYRGGAGPKSWRTSVGKPTNAWKKPIKPRGKKGFKK